MTQRILLADDEETITSELAPLLERSGFEVVVARDGTEALRLAGALAAFFARHPLPAGNP
jgi:DNA-binding response OmpR family regulator